MVQLLKISECAERVGVDPMTIRRWVWTGLLPSVKLGKTVRIDEADLDRFIESSRTAASAAR